MAKFQRIKKGIVGGLVGLAFVVNSFFPAIAHTDDYLNASKVQPCSSLQSQTASGRIKVCDVSDSNNVVYVNNLGLIVAANNRNYGATKKALTEGKLFPGSNNHFMYWSMDSRIGDSGYEERLKLDTSNSIDAIKHDRLIPGMVNQSYLADAVIIEMKKNNTKNAVIIDSSKPIARKGTVYDIIKDRRVPIGESYIANKFNGMNVHWCNSDFFKGIICHSNKTPGECSLK